MYKNPYQVRQLTGSSFATIFDHGLTVPWKALSIGDFIKYTHDYARPTTVPAIIEDEIFKKCVIDEDIIRRMDYLPAGVTTTVTLNIWDFSGPTSIESFNQDLQNAREYLVAGGLKPIHELVHTIILAFPYKPEEVYAMDYETFMIRLAQAEEKLLAMGMIKEPVSLVDRSEEVAKAKQKNSRIEELLSRVGATTEKVKEKIDAKAMWDKQEGRTPERTFSKPPEKKEEKKTDKKWYKVSPVLETTAPIKMDFDMESREHDAFGMTGHEKLEIPVTRSKLIADAQVIYKDVLDALAKKKLPK